MENAKSLTKIGNIAYCGLYCENCGKYSKGKCPGCAGNEKATWCGVRKCCVENGYKSCADCATFADPMKCTQFNNPISKVIGFILRSDRGKCIQYIKKNGYGAFSSHMDQIDRMSMKR
jgi:hypothetical protein